MEYLFLCFSPVDQDIVDRLAGRLESAGYMPWLAEAAAKTGASLARQTVFAIERSDAFLLILSAESVKFDSFREQMRIAVGAGKPILSLIVGAVLLPPDLDNYLSRWPVIELSQDLDLGFEKLLKWLEEGDTAGTMEAMPVEWIGDETVGEIERLPEEKDIRIEEGYYWYENWKNLTSVKAHLTNKRLIFFWDSRDAWKWNKKEWDQLSQAFPISLLLTDITAIGQIQNPKTLLIIPTSKPFVEIETRDGHKHKITLQDNFEGWVTFLRQVLGERTTSE